MTVLPGDSASTRGIAYILAAIVLLLLRLLILLLVYTSPQISEDSHYVFYSIPFLLFILVTLLICCDTFISLSLMSHGSVVSRNTG